MSPLVVEQELERKRKRKLKLKLKLSGGLMPVPPKFNAYTHRLSFLCLASYREGQTKKEKLGPVAPRRVYPRSPNFQSM